MTGPPVSPDPPERFDLEDALNALVDGELGAFAHEHGLAEDAALARLEVAPDFTARRAELERTRAAVRESPTLNDVTRERLVRHAMASAPRVDARAPRSRRWLAVTAIAAAGVLVVAGIGVAVSSMSNNSSTSSSKSAASSAAAPLHGDVGDLGDVTSAGALKALLDRRAAGAGAGSDATKPRPAAGGAAADSTAPAAGPSPSGTASCAEQLAGGRTVMFTGTGTYHSAPVTIAGVRSGGRTVVFVVSDADCTDVLASISR